MAEKVEWFSKLRLSQMKVRLKIEEIVYMDGKKLNGFPN